MTREDAMWTPIFDQLVREMTQQAEPETPAEPSPDPEIRLAPAEPPRTGGRRRRRAE